MTKLHHTHLGCQLRATVRDCGFQEVSHLACSAYVAPCDFVCFQIWKSTWRVSNSLSTKNWGQLTEDWLSQQERNIALHRPIWKPLISVESVLLQGLHENINNISTIYIMILSSYFRVKIRYYYININIKTFCHETSFIFSYVMASW